MPDHLELPGCRHDILGHYVKAIGLRRVLANWPGNARRHLEAERGRKVSPPANLQSLPEATTRRLGGG